MSNEGEGMGTEENISPPLPSIPLFFIHPEDKGERL